MSASSPEQHLWPKQKLSVCADLLPLRAMARAGSRKKPAAAGASLRRRPAAAGVSVRRKPAAAGASQPCRRKPAAAGASRPCSLLEALQNLGRWPKRRFRPKGAAEIAENSLAIRLFQAFQEKKVGEDPELLAVLEALPKEQTLADQVMDKVRALGRPPKRRKNPSGDAQIAAENRLARQLSRLRKNSDMRKKSERARAQESLQAEEDSVHCTSSPSRVAAVIIANNPTRSQPKRALKRHHTV